MTPKTVHCPTCARGADCRCWRCQLRKHIPFPLPDDLSIAGLIAHAKRHLVLSLAGLILPPLLALGAAYSGDLMLWWGMNQAEAIVDQALEQATDRVKQKAAEKLDELKKRLPF